MTDTVAVPQMRVWWARWALWTALRNVCAPQLLALLEAAREQPEYDDQEAIVGAHLTAWGLPCAWLEGPLLSLIDNVGRGLDWTKADFWQSQFNVPVHVRVAHGEIMSEWRNPIAPVAPAIPPGAAARREWKRTWGADVDAWWAATRHLAPVEANPSAETRQQFLDRAAMHYGARAVDAVRRGGDKARKHDSLGDHAEWTAKRYVLREPPSTIAGSPHGAETVRRAIREFARVACLPAPPAAKRASGRKSKRVFSR